MADQENTRRNNRYSGEKRQNEDLRLKTQQFFASSGVNNKRPTTRGLNGNSAHSRENSFGSSGNIFNRGKEKSLGDLDERETPVFRKRAGNVKTTVSAGITEMPRTARQVRPSAVSGSVNKLTLSKVAYAESNGSDKSRLVDEENKFSVNDRNDKESRKDEGFGCLVENSRVGAGRNIRRVPNQNNFSNKTSQNAIIDSANSQAVENKDGLNARNNERKSGSFYSQENRRKFSDFGGSGDLQSVGLSTTFSDRVLKQRQSNHKISNKNFGNSKSFDQQSGNYKANDDKMEVKSNTVEDRGQKVLLGEKIMNKTDDVGTVATTRVQEDIIVAPRKLSQVSQDLMKSKEELINRSKQCGMMIKEYKKREEEKRENPKLRDAKYWSSDQNLVYKKRDEDVPNVESSKFRETKYSGSEQNLARNSFDQNSMRSSFDDKDSEFSYDGDRTSQSVQQFVRNSKQRSSYIDNWLQSQQSRISTLVSAIKEDPDEESSDYDNQTRDRSSSVPQDASLFLSWGRSDNSSFDDNDPTKVIHARTSSGEEILGIGNKSRLYQNARLLRKQSPAESPRTQTRGLGQGQPTSGNNVADYRMNRHDSASSLLSEKTAEILALHQSMNAKRRRPESANSLDIPMTLTMNAKSNKNISPRVSSHSRSGSSSDNMSPMRSPNLQVKVKKETTFEADVTTSIVMDDAQLSSPWETASKGGSLPRRGSMGKQDYSGSLQRRQSLERKDNGGSLQRRQSLEKKDSGGSLQRRQSIERKDNGDLLQRRQSLEKKDTEGSVQRRQSIERKDNGGSLQRRQSLEKKDSGVSVQRRQSLERNDPGGLSQRRQSLEKKDSGGSLQSRQSIEKKDSQGLSQRRQSVESQQLDGYNFAANDMDGNSLSGTTPPFSSSRMLQDRQVNFDASRQFPVAVVKPLRHGKTQSFDGTHNDIQKGDSLITIDGQSGQSHMLNQRRNDLSASRSSMVTNLDDLIRAKQNEVPANGNPSSQKLHGDAKFSPTQHNVIDKRFSPPQQTVQSYNVKMSSEDKNSRITNDRAAIKSHDFGETSIDDEEDDDSMEEHRVEERNACVEEHNSSLEEQPPILMGEEMGVDIVADDSPNSGKNLIMQDFEWYAPKSRNTFDKPGSPKHDSTQGKLERLGKSKRGSKLFESKYVASLSKSLENLSKIGKDYIGKKSRKKSVDGKAAKNQESVEVSGNENKEKLENEASGRRKSNESKNVGKMQVGDMELNDDFARKMERRSKRYSMDVSKLRIAELEISDDANIGDKKREDKMTSYGGKGSAGSRRSFDSINTSQASSDRSRLSAGGNLRDTGTPACSSRKTEAGIFVEQQGLKNISQFDSGLKADFRNSTESSEDKHLQSQAKWEDKITDIPKMSEDKNDISANQKFSNGISTEQKGFDNGASPDGNGRDCRKAKDNKLTKFELIQDAKHSSRYEDCKLSFSNDTPSTTRVDDFIDDDDDDEEDKELVQIARKISTLRSSQFKKKKTTSASNVQLEGIHVQGEHRDVQAERNEARSSTAGYNVVDRDNEESSTRIDVQSSKNSVASKHMQTTEQTSSSMQTSDAATKRKQPPPVAPRSKKTANILMKYKQTSDLASTSQQTSNIASSGKPDVALRSKQTPTIEANSEQTLGHISNHEQASDIIPSTLDSNQSSTQLSGNQIEHNQQTQANPSEHGPEQVSSSEHERGAVTRISTSLSRVMTDLRELREQDMTLATQLLGLGKSIKHFKKQKKDMEDFYAMCESDEDGDSSDYIDSSDDDYRY